MVEYAYKENGVMKLKPVALSLSQAEIDEIATELLEAMQPDWQNAIGVSTSQIPYTVPADGFFVAQMANNTISVSNQKVYINNIFIGDILTKISISGTVFWRENNFSVPVSKGDVITITDKDNGTTFIGGYAWFVPFKTSNPVSLRPLDPHKIDTAILNHWDDITSDFSTAGSSAGFVLDRAVYNPILRKLRVNFHITNSFAANTNKHFILTYNGSDLPAFTTNCMYSSCMSSSTTIASVGFEDSYTLTSNKFDINIYNRNTNTAWASGTSFTTQIEF